MAPLGLLPVLAAGFLAAASAAPGKPHILLVLADDYGWGGLGVHRRGEGSAKQAQLEAHTPHLDALIDEGILLERHYAYKICSPSRSSLQSGRLAVHVNVVNLAVTVANLSDPVSGSAGIPRNMTGMAKKLREAGYRTHMIGKWDAGMATPEHTPWGRGYETWTGYFQHANDYWYKNTPIEATGEIDTCVNKFKDFFTHNATYRGGVRDEPERCTMEPRKHEACYEEAMFKERALDIIRNHDASNPEAPMFLFYAFHLLHTPLQVPESYLQRIDEIVKAGGGQPFDSADRRLLSAMAMYLDEALGEVVDALKAKGMWDDTLLVFTADNGGAVYVPGSGNNHPLKGGKFSDFEGGVRVNAFVSGGFVPNERRGSKFEGVVSIADWYGTFCELAGVDPTDHMAAEANEWLRPRGLPLLPAVDSVPQWGFIMNGTNGRPSLHLSEQALLQWPYKLVVGKQPYSGWQGEVYPNCTTIANFNADHGPVFVELKVFGQGIPLAKRADKEAEILWEEDCAAGCLYNVEEDHTEHRDLAKDPAYAAVMDKLRKELALQNMGNFNPYRGTPMQEACLSNIDIGGFYGPFLHAEGWYSPVPHRSLPQRLKDAMLKEELRALNSRLVVEGVPKLVAELMPLIRIPWGKTMDKCLKEDDVIVV